MATYAIYGDQGYGIEKEMKYGHPVDRIEAPSPQAARKEFRRKMGQYCPTVFRAVKCD